MATKEDVPANTVQAGMPCYTHKGLVEEWNFTLEPLHDFELNGETAQYAPGHPRKWGDETHWLNFRKELTGGKPEMQWNSYYAAVSSDHKLLAITSRHERILVYEIESQELRQVLDGAGDLKFAILPQGSEKASTDGGPTPAYSLGCSASDEGNRTGIDNQLIFWELDEQGRLLDQEEPIDASAFATQAIDAILPDLAKKHEWSNDFIEASSLHADLTKVLRGVATTHRRRHNTVFVDADFGKFGSTAFSNNGRRFLYHTQNHSTQSSMRDPDDLPRVVVMDIQGGKELFRLAGHTDAIMWSAISPNNEHIASVAWDGSLRMYSAITGELEWAIAAGGQAWTGAFSADSNYIVWSTGNGRTLFVHEVEGGRGVASFPEKYQFQDWCRSLAWHPDGQQIALCAGKHAYVWRPFDGHQGEITQHYQIEDDKKWQSMTSIENVGWLDHGRLLHLYFSEGTNLVYNTDCNTKELFAHPKGVETVWVSDGFHAEIKVTGIQGGYISVDGDCKVRYWSSGVVDLNSWWDNAPEKKVKLGASSSKQFPETGKYVMVTTREKGKDENQEKTANEISANKEGSG